MAESAYDSWWITDFNGRKTAEQARMRVAPLPSAVDDFFQQQERAEERELLGRPTAHQRSHPITLKTLSASITGGVILDGDSTND